MNCTMRIIRLRELYYACSTIFLGKCAARPGGSSGRPTPTEGYKGCGALSAGGQRRPPLRRVARSACVRADVGIGPYGEHCMKCGGVGRCGHRPLRKRIMGCVGEGLCPARGRPQGSPLRRGYKECDAVRNPPVTASPCQPPLGKGAEGTGDADCHSQCAHWLRNDTLQVVQ